MGVSVTICENCGAENPNENSSHCRNCLKPLKTVQSNQPEANSPGSRQSDESTTNIPCDSEPTRRLDSQAQEKAQTEKVLRGNSDMGAQYSKDDELFEIKEVDFGDSSVPGLVTPEKQSDSQPKPVAHSPEPDDDTIRPEPIEKELTLYRDDELQITMEETDNGPAITLANRAEFLDRAQSSNKETTKNVEADQASHVPEIPKEDLIVDRSGEKSVTQRIILNPSVREKSRALTDQNLAPSTSSKIDGTERPGSQTPPFRSSSIAGQTQKKPSHSTLTPEREAELAELSKSIEANKPAQSLGIAYLSRNSIKFAGGYNPKSGDKISIDDRVYVIKEKPARSPKFYAMLGGGALLFLILIFALFNAGPAAKGQITGVIIDPQSGGLATGLTVKIKELDQTTKSSYAGFFVFDQIPSGIYTIELEEEGVGIVSERLTVLENQTSTLKLSLPVETESRSQSRAVPKNPITDVRPASAEPKPGFLKLKISPSSASVYYDGEFIGKGSQTFKVPSGKHTVRVIQDGYAESTQKVDVPEDKVVSHSFTLKKSAGSSQPRKKTDEERAEELEDAGQYSEALNYYRKIFKQHQNNVEALLGIARCHKATGNTENALSAYRDAVKLASDQNDTPTQLGALGGILDINPNYLTARYSRGLIYLDQAEYYKAAQDFTKVIEIDRRHLNGCYKLAEAYYKLQNYPAALEAYERVQNLNFADVKPFAYMAIIYQKLDDKKNMKKCYEKFEKAADMVTKNQLQSDPDWQSVQTAVGK